MTAAETILKDGQIPYACVIGAQKAGTTSLYGYLAAHPSVAPSNGKESHLFDVKWPGFEKYHHESYQHYRIADLHGSSSFISVDASPSYLLFGDRVIPRIEKLAPWMKFIVLFRDPVDRAYSQFKMFSGVRASQRSFELLVTQELDELERRGFNSSHHSFSDFYFSLSPGAPETTEAELRTQTLVRRGLYAFLLRPWLAAFPRGRFLFLKTEDMESGLSTAMHRVYSHLGLSPFNLTIKQQQPRNVRKYSSLDKTSEVVKRLERFFKMHNVALPNLVGDKRFVWHVDPDHEQVCHNSNSRRHAFCCLTSYRIQIFL